VLRYRRALLLLLRRRRRRTTLGTKDVPVGVFARSDERQKESAPIEPLAARSGSVFGPPALLYLARRPVKCVSTNVE
jgi:hypothetical protein